MRGTELQRVAALIPAAGKSSRMGSPKALLLYLGKTFIHNIVTELCCSGINHIFVTLPTSHGREQVTEILSGQPVALVENLFPDREMLGSIQSMLLHHAFNADALLICPVDMPFIRRAHIERLLSAFEDSKSDQLIFCASHGEEIGHPILVKQALYDAVRRLGINDSIRSIIKRYAHNVVKVECHDEKLILNINTPQDYERHLG